MLTTKEIVNMLGKTFNDSLEQIAIKSLLMSRKQVINKLHCSNFNACTRLDKVLKKLKITSPKQLHKVSPFDLARCKGIGVTSIYVAMCILDYYGYSVEKWWGWEHNDLKFSSFKHKAIKRSTKSGHEL